MKKLFLLFSLLACVSSSTPLYVFHSDAISTKQAPKWGELLKLALRHPRVTFRALCNFKQLKKRGIEIRDTTPGGSTNIVLQLIEEFGYTELYPYTQEIVAATLNHTVNKSAVKALEDIKRQDPTAFAILVTNQDRQQFLLWQKKLQEQGININELCNVFITLWCPLEQTSNDGQEVMINGCTYIQFPDGSIMCPKGVYGMSPEFFEILLQRIKQQTPQPQVVICAGTSKEVLEKAALQKGITITTTPLMIAE